MAGDSQHILSSFQEALDKMNGNLDRMGDMVKDGLTMAVKCLSDRDTPLYDEVAKNDGEIDQFEVKIDGEGLRIIVLFQPVAADLRKVISVMKVSGNLERVGDEAVNISKRARRLNKRPEMEEVRLVQPAFEMAASLLHESLHAFRRGEVGEALGVKKADKELNRICKEAGKKLTAKMEASPDRVKDLVNLVFVFRSLERIGDHAKNIAEDTVFAESAFDIRHGGQKPEVEEEE